MSDSNILSNTKNILDNSTLEKIVFIFVILIIFIILLNLAYYFINYFSSSSQNIPIYLLNGVNNGYSPITIIQNPDTNPDTYILRSNNRNNGTEFTWSLWLYVNDIVSNSKPNTFQNIFNKGNNQYDAITGISTINNAPGLYLSKNTNSLRVIMDIFTSNINNANNYADITNIPLKKWFHIIIRLNNRNIDIYINGIVTENLYLINVPKQNFDNIYICQNGGFSGNLSNLFYYNYSLSIIEIQNLVNNGPGLNYSNINLQTDTSTLKRSSINNYLSPAWYVIEDLNRNIDLSLNIINNNKFNKPVVIVPQSLPIFINKLNNNTISNNSTLNDISNNNLVENGLIQKTITPLSSTVSQSQPTIMQIIKALPFSLNPFIFSTNFTDMMNGDVRALDQHNIDCYGNAINSFQYINPGNGTFNYNYMCDNPNGGSINKIISNSTSFTNTTGSTLDLVNQDVQCPSNSVLSQFQLFNNTPLGSESSATQFQYKYKCLVPSDTSTQPLTCRNVSTPFTSMNANSQFLDKSNIKCNASEALSGFKYVLSNDSTQYQYQYTCCQTPYSS